MKIIFQAIIFQRNCADCLFFQQDSGKFLGKHQKFNNHGHVAIVVFVDTHAIQGVCGRCVNYRNFTSLPNLCGNVCFDRWRVGKQNGLTFAENCQPIFTIHSVFSSSVEGPGIRAKTRNSQEPYIFCWSQKNASDILTFTERNDLV